MIVWQKAMDLAERLSGEPCLSRGGKVRLDKPTPSCGGIGSGEYCGGAGTFSHQGVFEPSQHGSGFLDGSRDVSSSQRARRLRDSRPDSASVVTERRSEPDDIRSS